MKQRNCYECLKLKEIFTCNEDESSELIFNYFECDRTQVVVAKHDASDSIVR